MKRQIIGVILTRTADTEQRELLRGIIPVAWQHNTDVVVISNIYDPEYDDEQLAAENDIYRLTESPDLCGLILVTEAFINPTHRKQISQLMNNRGDVPQIAVGSYFEGFDLEHCISLNTADADDIADLTEHLVTVHGFTEIDLLTGFQNYSVSHLRIDGYRRTLEKHGIPFDESRVMFGDFWMPSGEKLAKAYISGERKMPQAVICANDHMAYGILDVFSAHGISVPENLTIVGYEFVRERHMHTPILTTFQRNREALGRIVTEMLLKKIRTGEFGDFVPPRGRVICGNSCTCGIKLSDLDTELSAARTKAFYEFLHLYNQLEQRLTEAHSIRDFCGKFVGSEYLLPNIGGAELCLYRNWNHGVSDDSAINCYTIYNASDNGQSRTFNRLNISALTENCDTPAVYYCSPLFFSDRPLGFIVTRYDIPATYDHIFRSWMKTVSNALEILRMKNDIRYLMDCCNLSEYQDTLTGLPNRKGFSHELHILIDKDKMHQPVFCLLLQTAIDRDSLSLKNKKSELAVHQEISAALQSLTSQFVLARLEENIYAVAGLNNKETTVELLHERITSLMLNNEKYIGLFGMDSFCIASVCTEYNGSTELLETAEKELMTQVRIVEEMHSRPHYRQLINARSRLYSTNEEPLSAETLCRQYLISAGHFRKIYKETFGIAYHQDIIRQRMMKMIWLLISTDLDLSAITEHCGYDDYGYCLRLFRQFTGYTPNKYRKL